MEIHPLFGPTVIEKGWVPAPSYLLRRDRVLRMLATERRGDLLEIGCGAGTLLYELGEMGFNCSALESSPAALDTATYVNGSRASIYSEPNALWSTRFDYLVSMEVLEHIEDDNAALLQWHRWLKPGGQLVMSVPAHQSKWTVSDDWAGHFRRYEKGGLIKQLVSVGFDVIDFETWGFPLSNLLLSWRANAQGKQLKQLEDQGSTRQSNSEQSGVNRDIALRLYPSLDSLLGRIVMRISYRLQHFTKTKDWGVGYLVKARKSIETGESDAD